jgi:cytidylate kinase
MNKITIAIDGHSSCGKSTMAKDLAREIGYVYIDTGAMYRAVTLYCLQNGLIKDETVDTDELRKHMDKISITFLLNPTTGKPDTYLNGVCVEDKIRTLEVSSKVSYVAALGFVREAMVDLQRLMGEAKGVIMDGRDIGTVVFPNAELKIFVTASDEIRAQRRYDELTAKGEKCNMEDIIANIRERDRIDSTRAVSPLRKADDAIILDNSNMTIAEQKAWLISQFQRVTAE